MLVIIDVHSKWVETIPMHSATADTTVNDLCKFFHHLDYLKKL